MRLLLITFTFDEADPVLSWQVYVAKELAKKVDKVVVITSHIGAVDSLPSNVDIVVPPVRPLGIPQRFGGKWAYNFEVYKLCRKHNIDAVFIHMAKNWAYTLWPTFKLLKIPVVLWYAHGTVTYKLRLAVKAADRVVTSTNDGCRINDNKIRVIGQAINTNSFNIIKNRSLSRVLYVGRISPRKQVQLLYQVYKKLKNTSYAEIPFDIVGGPLNSQDDEYYKKLISIVAGDNNEKNFRMLGAIQYKKLPDFYKDAFLHINVSETGSMDKTVLESLSSGCPVLTSNKAFFKLLENYPEFLITDSRPDAIADKVLHIYKKRHVYDSEKLRSLVTGEHDLFTYADRVLDVINEINYKKGVMN